MVVTVTCAVLIGFVPQADATQTPTTSRTATIDRTISGLAAVKLRHAGYPATCKTTVRCHVPRTLKVGGIFHCTVFELPAHQSRLLNEGLLTATVSTLNLSHASYAVDLHAAPIGLEVGPGPSATYSVQPQSAAGHCIYKYVGPDPLPDPTCTPGAINPQVAQVDIDSTICRSGYTSKIRPPESVTEAEKKASALAYGYTGSLRTAEYDHLVPLELGGDPNDPANLWVEPNDRPAATTTSNTKDILEDRLNSLVCSGQVPLAVAQEAIASNWVAALAKYVGNTQVVAPTQPAPPTTASAVPTTTPAPTPTTAPTRVTSPPVPTTPPAPTPPPPPASSCAASMSNPTPGDGGNETVNITSNVPSTAGTINVHYKTTTHPFSFQTDASGNAQFTFDTGHPTVGFTVEVDVTVGAASCSTSFTPQ